MVGRAGDGNQALERIRALAPDLVIMDIQMPGKTGLRAAADIDVEPRPELVFVTAHEHYAPDAFEVDAADYLLKPVRFDRLRQAVDRARRRRAQRDLDEPRRAARGRGGGAARGRERPLGGRRRLLDPRAPRPAPRRHRIDRLDRGGARLCAAAHRDAQPFAQDHDGGAGGAAGGHRRSCACTARPSCGRIGWRR